MATERFGPDDRKWVFKCPSCGGNQNAAMFIHYDVPPKGKDYKICIGRWVKGIGACSYGMDSPVVLPTENAVIDVYGRVQPVFDFGTRPAEHDPERPWLTEDDIEARKREKARLHKFNPKTKKVETTEL